MSSGGAGEEGRPLSNADFRQMLATPRPGAGPHQQHREKKKKPKPGKGPHKDHRPPGEDQEDGSASPGYRDRALERRQGLGPELTGIPHDLVNLLNDGESTALHGVSYEESKYLGGDVTHTHLVKGLDFALLQKMRAEAAKEEAAAAEDSEDRDSEDESVPAAPPASRPASHAPFKPRHVGPPLPTAPRAQTRTAMGEALHEFLFGSKQATKSLSTLEMFQPRRTSFVYDMEGLGLEALPTTLHRAKEDCPKVVETLQGDVDAKILERLVKIMSYMAVSMGGSVKKKAKKKETGALAVLPAGVAMAGQLRLNPHPAERASEPAQHEGSPARPAIADEDENIFDDDGEEYHPERRGPAPGPTPPVSAGAGHRVPYFGEIDAGIGPRPPSSTGPHPEDPNLGAELLMAPPPPPLVDDEEGVYPDTSAQYPDTSAQYPDTSAQYPDTSAQYPDTTAQYPDASAQPVVDTGVAFYMQDEPTSEPASKDAGPAKKAQKLVLADADDGYAECYPSYFDAAGTVVDSEGEDEQREEVPLSRLDFETQAEWEAYSATQTASASKASNQRKAHRERNKEAVKSKNKLESQLGQIKDLMEKKGQSHTTAFEKSGRTSRPTVKVDAAVPQKKRRI